MIDEHVLAELAAPRIPPSPASSDAEFLRRAYLDTIGTLPEAAEAAAFAADPSPGNARRVVERLLARPEFVDFWTLQWADLLQNRKDRDGDNRTAKGVRSFSSLAARASFRQSPLGRTGRAVLTATGPMSENPAVGYFVTTIGSSSPTDSEVVARVAQAFLGTRIGCAQCHNHPLERYTQDDYYHFAAFFSPFKLDRKHPLEGARAPITRRKAGKNSAWANRAPASLWSRSHSTASQSGDPSIDPRDATRRLDHRSEKRGLCSRDG